MTRAASGRRGLPPWLFLNGCIALVVAHGFVAFVDARPSWQALLYANLAFAAAIFAAVVALGGGFWHCLRFCLAGHGQQNACLQGRKGGIELRDGDGPRPSGECRFSGLGRPANWNVVDIVRLENGQLAEHWDVIQDETTRESSKSGLPMFGETFGRLVQTNSRGKRRAEI
jgi:hypothetical protein